MKAFMENFKIARIQSKKSLRREGLVKFYLFYFVRIIFSLSIFLSPFLVSKWRLASEIKDENRISITGLFEPVSGKGYGHLLSANIIKRAIYLAILLVIVLFGGLLYWLGMGIAVINPRSAGANLIPILFTIPAALFLLMLIIAIPFIAVPNSYITNSYPALTPGRILKYSFYSLKNGGRGLMLKTLLFEYLSKILYLGGFGFLAYLPFMLMNNNVGLGITIILGVIFLGLFLYIDPIISLIALLIKSNIYDEIVFVKNSNKLTEININTNDIVIKNDKQETLNSLFKIEKSTNKRASYQSSLDENKKNEPKPKLNNKLIAEDMIFEEIHDEDEVLEEVDEAKDDIPSVDDFTEEVKEPEVQPESEKAPEPEAIEPAEEPKEEKPDDDPLALSEEDEAIFKEYYNEDGTEKTQTPEPKEDIEEPQAPEPEETIENPVEVEKTPEPEKVLEPQEETELESLDAEPELEEVELEEIKEEPKKEVSDDELEALLNSIPEAKRASEIAPKNEEPKEDTDDLEELLNSIPEKKEEPRDDEDLDSLLDSIPEKATESEEEISDSELDDILNSIPEKEAEAKDEDDLDALLDSIPEKEEKKAAPKKAATKKKTAIKLDEEPNKKVTRKKKGE